MKASACPAARRSAPLRGMADGPGSEERSRARRKVQIGAGLNRRAISGRSRRSSFAARLQHCDGGNHTVTIAQTTILSKSALARNEDVRKALRHGCMEALKAPEVSGWSSLVGTCAIIEAVSTLHTALFYPMAHENMYNAEKELCKGRLIELDHLNDVDGIGRRAKKQRRHEETPTATMTHPVLECHKGVMARVERPVPTALPAAHEEFRPQLAGGQELLEQLSTSQRAALLGDDYENDLEMGRKRTATAAGSAAHSLRAPPPVWARRRLKTGDALRKRRQQQQQQDRELFAEASTDEEECEASASSPVFPSSRCSSASVARLAFRRDPTESRPEKSTGDD